MSLSKIKMDLQVAWQSLKLKSSAILMLTWVGLIFSMKLPLFDDWFCVVSTSIKFYLLESIFILISKQLRIKNMQIIQTSTNKRCIKLVVINQSNYLYKLFELLIIHFSIHKNRKQASVHAISLFQFFAHLSVTKVLPIKDNKGDSTIILKQISQMIGGKKIQNFITFQTKQTIFLKQNQPQLIVHQHKIETDSFKQLLSNKRSKNKQNFFQSVHLKDEKQNLENNQPKVSQNKKSAHINSSHSKSKNNSKQRSSSAKYKLPFNEKALHHLTKVKPFDSKDQTKRSKSAKNKLSKKAKSMIRLPKFAQKNFPQIQSKGNRKSYSPYRNNSEGMKKTNINNYSTQCIKTTKFSESKDSTLKHLKSSKTDKTSRKQNGSNKNKSIKSKEKHKASLKNLNEVKSYVTEKRKQEEILQRIDEEKIKKVPKKASPSKKEIQKKRQEEPLKQNKTAKDKILPKKRKSMSKSKKNLLHYQSADEMLLRNQKYETTRYESSALGNYLSSRDSFKKKVKTDRESINKPKKKVSEQREKEVIISSKNLRKIQQQAAIKIQKAYKGYITRKWLGQYLKIIGSAVVIQKYWRGYLSRKRLKEMKQKNESEKRQIIVTPRVDVTVMNSKDNFDDVSINMSKWKDILFQVMEQKTVNQKLKSRIKQFLQHQNYHSVRSSLASQRSHRSHNSQQKLQEEIESQRRYFEKRQQKKQQIENSNKKSRMYLQSSPESFQGNDDSSMMVVEMQSPSGRRSLERKEGRMGISGIMTPQGVIPISPRLFKAQSPQTGKSPEKMISSLQQIQSYQRQNIIQQAKYQKQQLQQLLRMNVFSPRSCKLRQVQIDQNLQQSLHEFDQNIQNIIKSCKRSTIIQFNVTETQSLIHSVTITPEHSQVKQTLVREEIGNLSDNEVKSRLFEKVQEGQQNIDFFSQSQKAMQLKDARSMKLQLSPSEQLPIYENFQTFNVNLTTSQPIQQPIHIQQSFTKIDSSRTFLDQYLLTMIEYLRNKNDGKVMLQIVRNIKTYRNLEPYLVLRNLSVVKQENSPQDDGFALPMYKYLEDDMEIIKQEYVEDYNKYFHMMRSAHKFQQKQKFNRQTQQNQPFEHYLKLLVDVFNQALNLKRPYSYMFTDRAIETFNSHSIVQREQFDVQSEYDMYCAGAMQQIFTWFIVKYGCIVSVNEQQTTIEEIFAQNTVRLGQIVKMEVDKKWDQYYQKIQTIAKVSEEIFEQLMVKETITILNAQKKFLKQREILFK